MDHLTCQTCGSSFCWLGLLSRKGHRYSPLNRVPQFCSTYCSQKKSQQPTSAEIILIDRFLNGESVDKLAAELGITALSVYSWMRKRGVSRQNARYHSWNDKQIAEIVDRYTIKRESATSIAKTLGVSQVVIKRLLQGQNVEIRGFGQHHRILTDEQESKLFALYASGLSSNEVAKRLGLDGRTVRGFIAKRGGGCRTHRQAAGGLTVEQMNEVASLYEQGKSTAYLAESFGVSTTSIVRYLKELGIEIKDGPLRDSVQAALEGSDRFSINSDCSFYLFEMRHYSATHCKPGIAVNVSKRSDDEYGEETLRIVFGSRQEAFFLEQAVLDQTRGYAQPPHELIGWGGYTEIRAMPAFDLEPIVLRLADELEELGLWEFAARYVPMTAAQRVICQQRAMEPVAA